jgi:hypothetical protein
MGHNPHQYVSRQYADSGLAFALWCLAVLEPKRKSGYMRAVPRQLECQGHGWFILLNVSGSGL